MPLTGYLKIGDIKGESQDTFDFKSFNDVEPETDPVDDFIVSGGEVGTKGLLLPAVQQVFEDSRSTEYAEIQELGYTEVEWTY